MVSENRYCLQAGLVPNYWVFLRTRSLDCCK